MHGHEKRSSGSHIIGISWFILLFLLQVAGDAKAQQVGETAFAPQMVLSASELSYPPFAMVNSAGVAEGFSVDLLRASLNQMGRQVHFKVAPWEEIKNNLIQGEIQVLPLVGRSPEREAVFDFTFSYLTMHGAIFVRSGETGIRRLDDLLDKEVLVMKGDNAHEFSLRNHISSRIIAVDTYKTAFRMLAKGQHDAVFVQKLVGLQLIKDLGLTNIVPVGPPVTQFQQQFSFAVQEGDKEMLSLLNEGLSIVISNGTLERLRQEWFGPLDQERFSWRRFYQIALAIFITFLMTGLLALFWQKSLRYQIRRRTLELSLALEDKQRLMDQLQMIMNNGSSVIYIKDIEGKYLMINRSFEQLFNITNQAIQGKTDFELFPREMAEKIIANDRQVVSSQQNHVFEEEVIHGDQCCTYVSNKFPLQNCSGQTYALCGISTNITERKQMEAELVLAKKQADQANKAKSHYLANMSHEIRSPLNNILGFTQILLRKSKKEPLSQEITENLEYIELSVKNLMELINNILDLSKIEAGKLEVVNEAVNIRLLLQGIYHINKNQAKQKQLQFNYSLDPEMPEYLCTDRTKVNQILMNLTSNAIKFTPEGNKVTISARREQACLCLEVEDEGMGIPAEFQQKVFSPFEQGHASVTKKYGGTGLGLTLVKQLVELMGGRIELTSQAGQGTRFAISLPFEEVIVPDLGDSTEEVEIGRFSSENNKLVVVVEDNPASQRMLFEYFKQLGLEAKIAENGKEAIELIQSLVERQLVPSLILLDMQMPEMDGIEVTRILRRHPATSKVPIVVVSGNVLKEQREAAYTAGVNEYLAKPLDLNRLNKVVFNYLVKEEKQEVTCN